MKKTMQGKYRGHAFDLRVTALASDPAMTDRCWEWPGFADQNGYVHIAVRRADGRLTTMVAHKRAYMVLVGRVPKGRQLDHLCRNKRCFNPKHLEPVSPRVNVLRSDGPAAVNAAKTHCARGHPLQGANLTPNGVSRGWRNCRQCIREQDRERKKRQRRERGLKAEPKFIPPLKSLTV